MFPIDSPHLKILPQTFTTKERHQFLVSISLSRALHAKTRDSKFAPNSIQSHITTFEGYFVTQLTFGNLTSPFSAIVIVDTFSNHTWVQCAGCNPCFNLNATLALDDSPSFVRMNLNDARCVPRKNFDGSCAFESSFGQGHTEGYLGNTKFIFNYIENQENRTKIFPNIALGCGIKNNNFSFNGETESNFIAGVIGLTPGPRSFITQLDETINGRFSYCIPSGGGNTTTMLFGDNADIGGDDERRVQTIAMKPSARYHLYLAAIIVGGVRLHIDPTVFALDEKDYTTGFFIDPGSPITVLTNSSYVLVRNAMTDHFTKYGWDPIKVSSENYYDLCYSTVPDTTKHQVYPSVAFHFVESPGAGGEVEFLLPAENVFGKSEAEDGFCLKMVPSDGPSIFGAAQQANYRFLFDVNAELLSFVSEKC
ncbi:aspartic proteinase nepenthesin-1-like [Silene latifolia]|uniref:aspartic proteinase nepenthesin-1-like n=1 Tax=Silene latifolia TaxID=37657 RepID=UPI003D7727D3